MDLIFFFISCMAVRALDRSYSLLDTNNMPGGLGVVCIGDPASNQMMSDSSWNTHSSHREAESMLNPCAKCMNISALDISGYIWTIRRVNISQSRALATSYRDSRDKSNIRGVPSVAKEPNVTCKVDESHQRSAHPRILLDSRAWRRMS